MIVWIFVYISGFVGLFATSEVADASKHLTMRKRQSDWVCWGICAHDCPYDWICSWAYCTYELPTLSTIFFLSVKPAGCVRTDCTDFPGIRYSLPATYKLQPCLWTHPIDYALRFNDLLCVLKPFLPIIWIPSKWPKFLINLNCTLSIKLGDTLCKCLNFLLPKTLQLVLSRIKKDCATWTKK